MIAMRRRGEYLFGGVWGNIYAKHLKTAFPDLYNMLKRNGQLDSLLQGYQDAYTKKAMQMEAQRAQTMRVDEDLWDRDCFEYLLQSYRIQAEVRDELRRQLCGN